MSGVTQSVSVIGLGRMGSAMAATLRRGGVENLTVWNRDAAKADRLRDEIDVRVASTAAEAAGSDVVLTSLADDVAVKAVYLGAGGIVDGVRSGSVVVDTSTIDPDTVHEVGSAVDSGGGFFLDCPVSGSVSTVETGALTIMAGGDADQLDRVEPILGILSSRVIRVGPRGAGAATKLAVNGLVHGLNVALSEAIVLAERAGVDRATAYEVFASGAGGAPFVHYKREAYEHPDQAAVAFSLDLVAKDLELITALGRRVGAPLQQAQVGLGIVQRAIANGYGGRDLSAIAVFLREELT